MLVFWSCNWEEYHTGILKTSVGGVGLIEGQWILILMLLAHGLTDGAFGKATMRDTLPVEIRQELQANFNDLLKQVATQD